LRSVCDTAIEDIEEANAVREELSSRLSHRAFKPSSLPTATKGTQYTSFLKRMLGGFSAFQKEVGELYKDRVPGPAELLSDMQRLTRFHRRNEEVQAAAEEHRRSLPANHNALDPTAWRQLKTSIDANETLFVAMGSGVQAVNAATSLDGPAVVALAKQLSASIDHLGLATLGTPMAGKFIKESPDIAAAQIALWGDAATVCLEAMENARAFYEGSAQSTAELFRDIAAAARREEHLARLHGAFDSHVEWMPSGSHAGDSSTWARITTGIEAAERISRLTRNTQALHAILCSEDGLHSDALSIAIDNASASYQRLQTILTTCGDTVVLSPPGETEVEVTRRPLSTLSGIADSACEAFGGRLQHLSVMIASLRDGADALLSRLREDADVVERLNVILAESAEITHQLESFGIGPLTADDRTRIQWLAELAAAGRISPLLKAVASSSEWRQRLTRIQSEMESTITRKEFKASWEFLKTLFDLKVDVSTGFTIVNTDVGTLATHMKHLREQSGTIDEWLKFSRWRRDMQDAGFLPVLGELLEGKFEPEETVDVISIRFYRKLFDHLAATDMALSEFDIEEHERIRERFRQLDQWEIKAASIRIRQYQLNRSDRPRTGFAAAVSSELGILLREIAKKRKHMPLRRLFAEIPGVLQRLKPCIMMSPLSVSTFLESELIRFDLVIFDEALQVFPWDAIGAIYRGKQVIVAGDEKQLPPTNFFSRADPETDEEDDIGDFESILSLCKSINMPSKRLRWHYRSKREPLIAFSNRHFYDGDLVTFPSIRDASGDAVRFEHVPEGRWIDRKNLPEAERVADLMIDHLRRKPEKSLGVIAFNATQQRAIEDVIYDRRRNDPKIDAVFSTRLPEPYFIKSLETVQGDERDVIILSMAYGFSETGGKVARNFGPLSRNGGERRLNVAVTRAKEEMVFVASVRAADLDLSGITIAGSHLLKAYLEYAEKGVDSLAAAKVAFAGEAESPFEDDVAAALRKHGLEPVPQVGCGGFRIDMAIKHPQRPGEFCLGIECDGATYHSSQTARDRDRIRQSTLESLGWRIVRVWSTDWVRDPAKQVIKILAAYELAMQAPAPQLNASDGLEDEDSDFKPTVVEVGRPVVKVYSSIIDVPKGEIQKTAEAVLKRAGATEQDDLIKLVARELGFQRLGPRIRQKIEEQIQSQLRSGSLQRVGDRVSVAHT